jgi:hypothetical protein
VSDEDGQRVASPDAAETPRRPVSIERSVDEGVLIAKAAVTMDAKNYIIVEALREGNSFNIDEVRARVKAELLELAEENAENSNRLQQLSVDVQTPRGPRDNSEGYESDDHPTLTKRAVIHMMLGAELERLCEDDEFVAELAERARVRAWAEVGEAIEARLLATASITPDRFYEDDKAARIRALYNINLRALEKQAKRAGVLKR